MAESIPEKCKGCSDNTLFIQCYARLTYQDQRSFVLIFGNVVMSFLPSLCFSKELNRIRIYRQLRLKCCNKFVLDTMSSEMDIDNINLATIIIEVG